MIHTEKRTLALIMVGVFLGIIVLLFSAVPKAHALSQDILHDAYVLPGGDIAVFMVTFPTWSFAGDAYIPTTVVQSDSDALDPEGAHYYFEVDTTGEAVVLEGAIGTLYSATAEEIDGRYLIPKGTRHYLTLLVALPIENVVSLDPEDYSMRMRTLPFEVHGTYQQFNRYELTNYRTDYLDLEDGSTKAPRDDD